MKILILGGTGFLGNALSKNLTDHNHEVIAVGKTCNLLKYDHAKDFVSNVNPDAVIILAAFVGGIGLNMRNPAVMFHDNMLIGLNAVHLCYELGIRAVYLGTCCAYPKGAPRPFKEENLWDGFPEETNAPYGVVKRSMGIMIDAYRAQYGYDCSYLIPANLYGPHDHFSLEDSHVIPALIRKFHDAKTNGNKVVTLWGDGSPTREFLYVSDCAEGIRLALEVNPSEPINIGNGIEVSIKDLSSLISGVVGFEGDIIWDTTQPNGQPRRYLDVTKAEKLLNFKAKVTLQEGIEKTYEWFRNSF